MKTPSPAANDLLTREDALTHVLVFYFGGGPNKLELCIARAYRDFSRTLHGLKDSPGASRAAHRYLHARLAALPSEQNVSDQQTFDAWHHNVCTELRLKFNEAGFERFHIGQAQKWLNMALKYVFVFGEAHLSGYARFFAVCHIPVDSVILESKAFTQAPKFGSAWSRIDDYAQYLKFQQWTRSQFLGRSPLAVEFETWSAANEA